MKNRQTIVTDINNGKKINNLFTQFYYIKTDKQYELFKDNVIKFKTGTYNQFNILDIISKFDVISETPTAKEFIKSVTNIINKCYNLS